jgi:hypothetical protein
VPLATDMDDALLFRPASACLAIAGAAVSCYSLHTPATSESLPRLLDLQGTGGTHF